MRADMRATEIGATPSGHGSAGGKPTTGSDRPRDLRQLRRLPCPNRARAGHDRAQRDRVRARTRLTTSAILVRG